MNTTKQLVEQLQKLTGKKVLLRENREYNLNNDKSHHATVKMHDLGELTKVVNDYLYNSDDDDAQMMFDGNQATLSIQIKPVSSNPQEYIVSLEILHK